MGLNGEASKDQESSGAETRKKSENYILNLKGFRISLAEVSKEH